MLVPPLHVAVLLSPESRFSWPQMHSKSQCLNQKTRISSSPSRLRWALKPVLVQRKKTSSSRSSTLSVDLAHQTLHRPLVNQLASRSSVAVVVRRKLRPMVMTKLPLKASRLHRLHRVVQHPRSFLVLTANRLPNGKQNSFAKANQLLLN